MRFFIFSLLIIFIASCGTMSPKGHLRLIKVGKKDVPVIEKDISKIETTRECDNKDQVQQLEIARVEINPEETVELHKLLILPHSSKNSKEFEDLEPEVDEEVENQQIINQAIKAEKQAKNSVGLFGAGLISIFMPYFGLFFFVAGLIVYSNAKSSRYITPAGEEKLSTSKTLLIIDSVILGIWLLVFLLVLSIFLF